MLSSEDKREIKTISIEELKSFDGFSDISDEKALHIITSLKKIAITICNINIDYEQLNTIPKLRKAE